MGEAAALDLPIVSNKGELHVTGMDRGRGKARTGGIETRAARPVDPSWLAATLATLADKYQVPGAQLAVHRGGVTVAVGTVRVHSGRPIATGHSVNTTLGRIRPVQRSLAPAEAAAGALAMSAVDLVALGLMHVGWASPSCFRPPTPTAYADRLRRPDAASRSRRRPVRAGRRLGLRAGCLPRRDRRLGRPRRQRERHVRTFHQHTTSPEKPLSRR
jgi:hypothetical protein